MDADETLERLMELGAELPEAAKAHIRKTLNRDLEFAEELSQLKEKFRRCERSIAELTLENQALRDELSALQKELR